VAPTSGSSKNPTSGGAELNRNNSDGAKNHSPLLTPQSSGVTNVNEEYKMTVIHEMNEEHDDFN